MKLPKYAILSMQDALNAGLNAFAFQLLAESFADKAEKFGDENVILLSHAHGKDGKVGQEVWFVMTKTMPTAADFSANGRIAPVLSPASLNNPQPVPRPAEGERAAWDLVIDDIRERDALGVAKYGRRLTPGDGRDSLVDAYQEALDLVVYLRKAIRERAR